MGKINEKLEVAKKAVEPRSNLAKQQIKNKIAKNKILKRRNK